MPHGTMTSMQDMQQIQNMIANDLGIGALPDDDQKKLIAQFGAIALQASTIAVLEAMPPEKREQFTKILEAKDEAGARTFLDTEVPNHEDIARQAIAAEIARFKEFQKTI
jgi:hypothetical protein